MLSIAGCLLTPTSGHVRVLGPVGLLVDGQRPPQGGDPYRPEDGGMPPPAANDDFLNEATGGGNARARRGEQPPGN